MWRACYTILLRYRLYFLDFCVRSYADGMLYSSSMHEYLLFQNPVVSHLCTSTHRSVIPGLVDSGLKQSQQVVYWRQGRESHHFIRELVIVLGKGIR